MRLTLEPSLPNWPLVPNPVPAWPEMMKRLEGIPRDPGQRGEGTDTVIATGHQAWLWHPGILVKNLAAAAARRQHPGSVAVHVVVDHDAHPVLRLDLPVIHRQRLAVETLILAPRSPVQDTAVPTGCQEPADPAVLKATLHQTRQRLGPSLAVDLEPLLAAIPDASFPSLARQISAIVAALEEPLTGPILRLHTTDLAKLDSFRQFCRAMTDDARACVEAYNRAAAAFPEAGVPLLRLDPRRVELPLWLLAWNQPRRRVFADLSVGHDPQLSDERGLRPPPRAFPAPRALALTAFLRSQGCSLFIHGTGGTLYDQVMEHWWRGWAGRPVAARPLAPQVLATADLTLDLPVPLADTRALNQAHWWIHHLPHNLDRAMRLDGPAVVRKRELLAHMDDDRDRRRRAEAFAEIHHLNEGWATRFAPAVAQARAELDRAQVGNANRALSNKRDWFFGLYPPEQLRQLRQEVDAAAAAGR